MITLSDLKKDKEVKAIMDVSALQMDALGYTEHSERHCRIEAKAAGEVMAAIGASPAEINSAEIAGYLHDLGNAVNRIDHAQSGALLAYRILTRLGMDYETAAEIMMAGTCFLAAYSMCSSRDPTTMQSPISSSKSRRKSQPQTSRSRG